MSEDLEKLDTKIAELRKAQKKRENIPDAAESENQDNMRLGMRAGAELVTAIVAGALIGYWLDKYFETKPLFLLVMLVLGVITGFVNVWRTTQGIGTGVGLGYHQKLKQDSTDKEEQRDKD